MTWSPGPGELPVRFNERVETREAMPADLEAMAAVLVEAFEGWPDYEIPVSPLEHLRWKLGGPYGPEHPSFVGELDGRMVGLVTWLPKRALIRGERCTLLDGGDRAVVPDKQNTGVGQAIRRGGDSDLSQAHLRLAMRGRPVDQRWRERMRRQGSILVGNELRNLMLPLDIRRLAADRAAGSRLPAPALALLTHGARLVNRVRHRPVRRRGRPQGLALRGVDTFDERVNELTEAASSEFDFLIARESDYLNWRYCDPRSGRFEVRIAEDGDTLVGYAVCKLGRGRGFLVDLLARPGRLDVVEMLLADAVDEMQHAGASGIFAWLPRHHPYGDTLRRAGFLDTRRTLPLTYRVGGLAEPGELDFLSSPTARIHYAMGDRDVI